MNQSSNNRHGTISGIACYTIWGFMPIYWKELQALHPIEIFFQRSMWSTATLLIVLVLLRKWKAVEALKNPTQLAALVICAASSGLATYLFIYGVTNSLAVESSLGFFLSPALTIAVGTIYFKEKKTNRTQCGMFLLGISILIQLVVLDDFPWIALGIATSFSIYSVVKKAFPLNVWISVFFESLAISVCMFVTTKVELVATLSDPLEYAFLAGSGLATVLPLLLFSYAAPRSKLSHLGLLQYLAPTIQLSLALILFGEKITFSLGLSFSILWISIGLMQLPELHLLYIRKRVYLTKLTKAKVLTWTKAFFP